MAALSMSSGSSPRVGKRCRSRAHFVRVEEIVEGASPKVQWKCDHCQSIVFSGAQYRANIARIHLAASGSNGQCANLCTSKDSGAAERRLLFQSLIKKAEEKKAKRKRKLEQQAQRLVEREKQAGVNAMKRKKHQVKIPEIAYRLQK